MFEKSKSFTGGDIVIGFDLGTTNSVLSVYNGNIPEVILIDGGQIIPSFIEFTPDKKVKAIGVEARNNRTGELTVSSFKKYMGTDKKLLWDYTAEDIATFFVAEVFNKLRTQHTHLANANAVVVSVPAEFNINQTNATKQAFRRNNIKVVDVNIEPVSAALVYKELKAISETILVFDLGGGTFDGVLITNTSGVPKESLELYKAAGINLTEDSSKLSIMDITGDNRLGGDDIDEAAAELYKKASNSDRPMKDLIAIAELVKHSKQNSGDFLYEYVEQATQTVIDKCMDMVRKMLNKNNIQKVHCVLCGGSTKSPLIQDTLKQLFKVSSEIDPDLSVSIGNSMYAGKSQIIQRTPKYLGILVNGLFKTVVSKGTILPASETVYVKNLKPWETVVDVKFYQTNSLMGVPEHISTVEVSGLQGHDEDGYVVLGVKIECLLDGTINASVKSGGKVYNAALSYVDSIQAVQEPPLIAMTRKANSKLNDEELTRLLEKWDKANDLSLLSLMNKRLVACRKK